MNSNFNFGRILPFLVVGILLVTGFILVAPKLNNTKFPDYEERTKKTEVEVKEAEPVFEFGMRVDTFNIIQSKVLPNQFVSEILASFRVDNQMVHNLSLASADFFDFRKFRAGNNYTIFADKHSRDTVAKYLVYEKNPIEYVVYNLEDPSDIKLGERPTEKIEKTTEGTIEGSLWQTLIDSGADQDLAVKMAQVYQWTIDFTRINAGDSFKAVYDEIYVDGEFYRTDSIKACYFNRGGKELYAFYFDQGGDKQAGFYDENGESLKRAFLRAPVKFTRISSRYSGRRFHPVQKRYKAHLGTDYAAPHGTPIYSTADGTITHASYTRGNGRYVKIKHNSTYTTQYLHMSRIGSNIRSGVFVQQGDVIGYVGSTGLATGPHVCYRFWKNGIQVDHLALDLPSGDPISDDKMEAFEEVKAQYLEKLNNTEEYEAPTMFQPQILATAIPK